MNISNQEWDEIKDALPVGTRVHGHVIRVEPFGVFVKLTQKDVVAVLLVTHFEDGQRAFSIDDYPQIGDSVEAVVVDLADYNMQVRLSTRSSDMIRYSSG